MSKKSFSCFEIFALSVILIVLLVLGILKIRKGTSLADLFRGDGVEVNDICYAKKIKGNYFLTITINHSKNIDFQDKKLELYYNINLDKEHCTIDGNGKKLGYTLEDSTGKRDMDLKKDEKDIEVKGEIENDTLSLKVSYVTKTTKDCEVDIKFPFKENNITTLKGKFTENCNYSSGVAKLKKQ